MNGQENPDWTVEEYRRNIAGIAQAVENEFGPGVVRVGSDLFANSDDARVDRQVVIPSAYCPDCGTEGRYLGYVEPDPKFTSDGPYWECPRCEFAFLENEVA